MSSAQSKENKAGSQVNSPPIQQLVCQRELGAQWWENFKSLKNILKSIPDSQEEIYAFSAYLISVIIEMLRS